MRAAPYDLADLGFEPVPIETPEGKTAYVEAQREFARRGAPLRGRLVAECERLLDERDEGMHGPDEVAAHREAATRLLDRLARHRQRGSDLIYEAYAVDIGGSG